MVRHATLSLALLALIFAIAPRTSYAADEAATRAAEKAASAWLKLVDGSDYRASWQQSASLFRNAVNQDEWAGKAGATRKPLGAVVSRKLKRALFRTSLPGAPDGQYVVIQYDTSFENKQSAVETVTPMLDKDGNWRMAGYYIK